MADAHVGQEPRRPGGRQRTPAVAYLLMVLPFLSLGLAAWVPAFWAARKRTPGDPLRSWLFNLSGALGGGVAAAILLIDAAPEDADGTATGPLIAIGSIALICVMVTGTVVAVAFRRPPPPS